MGFLNGVLTKKAFVNWRFHSSNFITLNFIQRISGGVEACPLWTFSCGADGA